MPGHRGLADVARKLMTATSIRAPVSMEGLITRLLTKALAICLPGADQLERATTQPCSWRWCASGKCGCPCRSGAWRCAWVCGSPGAVPAACACR